MAQIQTPTKKCHNCRRQRLRCDRSYPHCNKCLLTGKECLGYGQLFRWTGAVASRGKLAGKTLGGGSDSSSSGPGSSDGSSDSLPSRTPSLRLSNEPDSEGVTGVDDVDPDEMQLVRASEPTTTDFTFSMPWTLVDPLYQDLSHPYRHYLSYFATRLCQDLVAFDMPEHNPFRTLVPLTSANPLLQHIIVAASAAHMSNLVRVSSPPTIQADGMIVFPNGEASGRALQDALVAKHKALRLMHHAVQNIDSVGIDTILAAALFFVNVELLESGKHGWKAHLEGAGRIMSLLPTELNASARDLRDYLLSDCFSYFILASTFMPATSTGQSYFESARIPAILGRATANSYICSAPEVLEILYAASQLSNVDITDEASAAQVAVEGMELLKRAQNFDIRAWAIDALNVSYLKDIPLESRINVGSAHRLAACVYIVQAVRPVMDLVGEEYALELRQAMLDQLKEIPPEDPIFKATSWSTFIAGAGATMADERLWAMDRLQKLVSCCPWGFFYTAMDTLQVIWQSDTPEQGGKGWVQTLKDPELNFLIV